MSAILHRLPALDRWPIELLLASSICLSLAWIAGWWLRRRAAALRAHFWLVAYLSIAALVTARLAGYTIPLPILRAPVEQAGVAAREIATVSHEQRRAPESRASTVSITPARPVAAPTIAPVPGRHFEWRSALGAVWLLGAGLGVLRIVAGSWALRRGLRSARPPAPGSPFAQALAEATHRLEPSSVGRGLRYRVLLHPEAGSPMSFGLRTWWIVLPAPAVAWSPERLRLVLAHELAHGVRRDHLALLLVRGLTACCWLNPLAWFGLRRFRLLCESAADDLAVAGCDPSSYVRELLQLVSELRDAPRLWSSAALSIAQRSSFEQRVRALLDGTIARRRVSRRVFFALLTAAGALAFVLPSLRAVAADQRGTAAATPAPTKPAASRETKTLSVFVRDQEGRPVAGAKVAPRGLRATLGDSSLSSWNPSILTPAVLTDAAGHATFADPSRVYEDMVTSTVEVWVSHPDFCDHTVEVEVAHPEPIILRRGARVTLATVQLQVKGSTSLSEQMALTSPRAIDPAQLTGASLAVAPGPDLEGQVVDETGAPLAGVLVDAWTYVPGNETKTDPAGKFRLKEPNDFGRSIEVQFSLAGYSPFHVTRQPVGRLLERVVLETHPCFEGVVRDSTGAPLAGQLIRACTGEKEADGVSLQHVWAETRSDERGHYLLRVFPDTYEIQVRSAANEVARVAGPKIGRHETRTLDLTLTPGVTFRARFIDTETRRPVAGVRLYHDEHPGLEGTSDADGRVVISGMAPGDFQFDVDAEKAGYRRWWSAQALGPYQRKTLEPDHWQRNFDSLDFEIAQNPGPVEIEVERGVRIRGTVRNASGQPVEGATVWPVRSRRGNTLTGDSRFGVRTKKGGRYEILLPASGQVEYNLMAHDGALEKWREFANGILPPIQTKPGEVRENADLTLSLPCVVRGRVVDQDGQPVTGREVRAASSDMLEGSLTNPTTRVAADGTFELRFLRAGRQWIQVSPFWLPAEAPAGTALKVTASPGVPVTGVLLTARPLEPEPIVARKTE